MSDPTFQVLIIGCGNIAGGFDEHREDNLFPLTHAGAYAQNDHFRLIACVDKDEDRQRTFAEYWNVERSATSVTDLDLSKGAFDVISICSPTILHYEHVMTALKLQPRVIFCEKPLASDIKTTVKLIEECQSRNVKLVVNYSRRWDPRVSDFFGQVQSGRWGRLRSVVGHYNKGICNNGSHMLDLVLRLVGPLDLVSTACATFDFCPTDPTVSALLTAQNGTIPVYLNPADARDYAYFELEIICEHGVIRMNSGGIDWQTRKPESSSQFIGYRTLGQAVHIDGGYSECMRLAINDIYKYLTEGKFVDFAVEETLQVHELCAQIQYAVQNKSVLDFNS